MDRLQTLEVFIAVAEAESFAGGARRLGLSAPSATRGVNALEERLQTRLFTRTTRTVRLTDTGRAYLDDARDILAQLHAADAIAAGAATTPTGCLRITCSNEFGRLYVAPILTEYLDLYPSVTVDVLMVDRIVNIVEEGFDIAVRIGALPSSGLTAVRIGEVRRVVCATPAYFEQNGVPKQPADLVHHKIIAAAPVSPSAEWRFGTDAQSTVHVRPRLTVSSVATARSVVRGNWGLCRVLSYQIGPDLEAGVLQTALDEYEPPPMPINLVHTEGRRAPAKVRAFLDLAKKRLRAIPALTPTHNSRSSIA
ncbi:LysR family transcriptional regulator [Roseobacter litoralis]|uniref:LysR family transcriptional regulator n=1 Tax=Roseobacter litoralis TaxID=42443 RepID=UPI0005C6F713|nr:LysR family transcriptional regulator [Roseobacter litoralis]